MKNNKRKTDYVDYEAIRQRRTPLNRGDDAHEFLSQSQCPKCSAEGESQYKRPEWEKRVPKLERRLDYGKGLVMETDRWEWNDNVLEQEYECRYCRSKFLLGQKYFFIREIK